MRYQYTDIIALEKTSPGTIQRALQAGQLVGGNVYIDLPEDFWFEGDAPKPVIRGLGDRIAIVAKPIAQAIKNITLGAVDYTNCGGCAEDQRKLNEMFPAATATTSNPNPGK